MKKVGCLGPLVVVIFIFWLIGTLTGTSAPKSAAPQPTTTQVSTPTPTATSTPTPKPTKTKPHPVYVPELIVDDLGESYGNCNTYETCTFVNIKAVATCKNASIVLDLYDENDDNYDTDSADVGTIKAGQFLKGVEVGSDDPDAWSVDAVDFTCG